MIQRNIKLYTNDTNDTDELVNGNLLSTFYLNYFSISKDELFNWNKLHRFETEYILISKPNSIKFCNLDKLNSNDWYNILRNQPQLIEFCDWDKIPNRLWDSIMIDQLEISKYVNWSKLTGIQCRKFLKIIRTSVHYSELVKYIDMSKLSRKDWHILILSDIRFVTCYVKYFLKINFGLSNKNDTFV